MKPFSLITILFLCIAQTYGALYISNVFGDNMVLQRAPLQANIFGWADAGASVVLTFNNQNYNVTAGVDGAWLVTLPATEAGGPYTIGISTSSGDKATLSNLLFGEVWLCGGQSNMQFTVLSALNSTAEVAAADNYPNIRVMSVGQDTYSPTPLTQLKTISLNWTVASSSVIGAGNWSTFSAVCWFTGRNMYDQYKVPIGLISSNWGGTVIQAWSSPVALQKCNVTASGTNQEANSVLYNAMIVPFQKQVIKGVLWYQGEQNAGDAIGYSCMFPAMISDWRANFDTASNFPFLFVQLSTWEADGTTIPDTRQAQLAALALPNVGFATAADLGDVNAFFGIIHPPNKQAVAARLINAVRNIAYGETSVVWQGPVFQSATVTTSGGVATVTVIFRMYGEGGLITQASTCPAGFPTAQCSNWAILLSDGVWHETTQYSIGAPNVVNVPITLAAGQSVKGVRYGYSSWPLMTLYSEQNLPVIPFEFVWPTSA